MKEKKSSKQRQLEIWKDTRAKGKKRFIIVNGMLVWGVPVGVIYTVITNKGVSIDKEFLYSLVLALIIFPIAGILMGLASWNSSEARYNEEITEEKQID